MVKIIKLGMQFTLHRTYQSQSQDSTGSSSIGANLDHLRPSPDAKTSHAEPASHPSPHTAHPPPLFQGPVKPPPQTYYQDNLYDHIGSKTLPSPKKDRKTPNSSPSRSSALKPESPLVQYRSSEHIHFSHGQEESSSGKQYVATTDVFDDMNDIIKELNANQEEYAHRRHTTASKMEHKSEAEKFRRTSDSQVEQGRHDGRDLERKLQNSQKLVTQLLNKSQEDMTASANLRSKPRRKQVQISDSAPKEFTNGVISIDNRFNKNVSPEPTMVHGDKEKLSELIGSGRPSITSPTGGPFLRNVSEIKRACSMCTFTAIKCDMNYDS